MILLPFVVLYHHSNTKDYAIFSITVEFDIINSIFLKPSNNFKLLKVNVRTQINGIARTNAKSNVADSRKKTEKRKI